MSAGNFTAEIKREIIRAGFENTCCKTAALSAFLRVTGSVVRSGRFTGFEFVTESEQSAEFAVGLLEEIYGAELQVVEAAEDARNGRNRLAFRCLSERSLFILTELGIAEISGENVSLKFDIDRYLIENECCKKAYIKGAFLGSGSCTLPGRARAPVIISKSFFRPIRPLRLFADFSNIMKFWQRALRGRGRTSYISRAGRVFPTFSICSARRRRWRASTGSQA